ncbi:unnamed protein product [Nesidiocoris tenuis]|uniref:Uncharacterized protein n=1 Tax=Nesidiocoris tenuis TaxID=355587 RepID=A0A6H5HX15_9HEMI|nr:unnamed protein product [Nesidiocoris tenuis]
MFRFRRIHRRVLSMMSVKRRDTYSLVYLPRSAPFCMKNEKWTPPRQGSISRQNGAMARHKSEKEKKIGHRRVGTGGEVTYKKNRPRTCSVCRAPTEGPLRSALAGPQQPSVSVSRSSRAYAEFVLGRQLRQSIRQSVDHAELRPRDAHAGVQFAFGHRQSRRSVVAPVVVGAVGGRQIEKPVLGRGQCSRLRPAADDAAD